MKSMNTPKKLGLVVGIALLSVVAYTRLTYTPPARAFRPTVRDKVQQGIGTLTFPETSSAVSVATDLLLAFTNDRGNAMPGSAVRNRLIAMEQQTLNGQAHRLNASQVSAIFTDTFFERVTALTDTEIKSVQVNQKVMPDFVIPQQQDHVQLRTEGSALLNGGASFYDGARAYRDSSTVEAVAQRAATPTYISNEVDKRLSMYQDAASDNWKESYTPLQIYVLFYSVVTDDLLEGTVADLAAIIQATENHLYTQWGIPRSSAGRKAYGLHGYLFSSSTDLFLSDAVLGRLLDRVDAAN